MPFTASCLSSPVAPRSAISKPRSAVSIIARPGPAGPSAAAWKRRSPDLGPPRSNISMSISATPQRRCRRRPRASAAKSCAPASTTGSDRQAYATQHKAEPRSSLRGFCLRDKSDGDFGRREGGHLRGEIVVPDDEARMILPPCAAETQIAIAEHAGKRDLPDVGRGRELWRRRLQRRQAARHLVGLAIDPNLHLLVG